MLLINKVTNKICDAEARDDGIYVKTNWGDGEKWHKYGLGCLGDNWEYYVEPKDSLIKDEKIRKAVRAWADLYGYKFMTHRFYTTTTGHRWSLLARETQEICLPELDDLDESKDYTIDELCGEEK